MPSLKKLFFAHVAQTSDFPLAIEVESAFESTIIDTNGKSYIDFDSGISVSSLGHRHPDVVKAITDQTARYMHTMVYGEHIQSPQVQYAALLAETLDNGLDTVYFVNSGSEAVEAAIKLARKATGRTEIISAFNAYHGSTIGAESLRSDRDFTQYYMPVVPGIKHIRFNNLSDLSLISQETAAVIVEPIQAEAGIILPADEYLYALQKKCKEVGALFILDEIQTGFGRTGKLFAFEHYRVNPDVLLIAKAMGGGMPCGGLVASAALMSTFMRNPALGHITTFGGHPVNIAAALATLQFLTSTDTIPSSVDKADYIYNQLITHPMVKGIRYKGLFMAIELVTSCPLIPLITDMIQRGVLVDFFLFNATSFRIAPPLIIEKKDLDTALSHIIAALDHCYETSKI
ncbi:MAG: aminotransferase class III-fold pyridoxal phosphate-dependent enzyme [Saprospiraceae bacterium]